jgi:hypothetical protein
MKYFTQEVLRSFASNENPFAMYALGYRSYKKYIPIASFSEWERIEINIGKSTYIIPSTAILNELIMMPVPDKRFIYNILQNYKILPSTINEINKILDRDNSSTFLEEILSKLNMENCDEKLIAILSLQTYRLEQFYDLESQLILKRVSDLVINRLRQELRNPSVVDTSIKKILEERGKLTEYQCFEYHKLVLIYLSDIFPVPLSPILDINEGTEWIISFQNYHHKKTPFPERAKNQNQRIDESEKRKKALFYDYRHAHFYRTELYNFIYSECPNFLTGLVDEYYEVLKNNRKRSRSKDENRLILAQCQFCYRYRFPGVEENGRYAWCCSETEYHKQYKKWWNYLRSRSVRLSTLYK